MKAAVEKGEAPAIVIFAYAPFHMWRNIGAPSWVDRVAALKDRTIPVVRKQPDGSLRHARERINAKTRKRPDPPPLEVLSTTMALFDEAAGIAREHGILPVLAVQAGVGCMLAPMRVPRDLAAGHCDPVALSARRAGFLVVDMSIVVDLNESELFYRVTPEDVHPNHHAHRLFADRLIPLLRLAVR